MERIKYIIFTLLILSGIVLPSELYHSYANCFSDFYQTTFYIPPDGSRSTMLADISNAAAQNQVSVFVMNASVENLFTNNITIYGDDTVRQHLKDTYFLHEGRCKSFFSGTTTVQFFPFCDVPDRLIIGKEPKYYLIGTYDDMVLMKQLLVDTYAGSFPVVDDYSTLSEMKSIQLALWGLLLLMFCFVDFYSLTTAQRELMVRVSMGERRMTLYLERVLKNVAVLVFSYTAFSWILSHFTAVSFLSTQRLWMFLGCVVGVCLVNIYLFRFQVRMAFQKAAGQQILTTGTYVIKVFACCFSLLTLTAALSTAMECISFYRQHTFFEKNNNRYYVEFIYSGLSSQDMAQVENEFLRIYYEKALLADPCYGYGDDEDTDKKNAILMNHAMLPYLREWIPEISSVELTSDICLLYPNGEPLTENDKETLRGFASASFGGSPDAISVQCVAYSADAEVMEIESNHLNYSIWKENPVIVLSTWDRLSVLDESEERNCYFRIYNFMIEASKEELIQFAEAHDCKAVVTNCNEYYLYCWKTLRRTLYLSGLLISLILWLNIAVSVLLVRFTYKKNAMELAVKKLTGYTIIERMRPVILTSVITIGVSTLCCVVVLILTGFFSPLLAVLAAVLICLLDYGIIRLCSIRYESENLQKILKGGNV